MTIIRVCVIAVFCVGVLTGPFSQSQNSSPPQTGRTEQTILLTVVDKEARFVETLGAGDVRVLEDDKLCEIVDFKRLSDRPLTLVLLIDVSASQEATLEGQRLAADAFVQQVLRPAKDEAAVVTFTGIVTAEQDLTKDVTLVREAIGRARFLPPAGYRGNGLVVGDPKGQSALLLTGTTALWEAIQSTADKVLSTASSRDTRKAMIVLSDGEDTVSRNKLSDAVAHSIKAQTAVYAIGIGDKNRGGVNKDNLRKVSERTGGRAFFPKKIQDLGAIFKEIEQELRSQYQIVYKSANSSNKSGSKVRIEITGEAAKTFQTYYRQLSLPVSR